MGGYGSGQYQSYDAKDTVEDSIILSIFEFTRAGIRWDSTCSGMITIGKSSMQFAVNDNQIRLVYRVSKGKYEGETFNYTIALARTVPNYGGYRLWWECPRCSKRCGKLYLAPSERRYLCRTCANVTYESTREMSRTKLLRYIQNFDKRLARSYQRAGLQYPPS